MKTHKRLMGARDNSLTPEKGSGRWLRVSRVIAVGLVVLGAAMIGDRAQAQASFPLDRYPGFGRSPEAAVRDDTIAYWEAFQREWMIGSCMSASGFQYSPAVAFPTEPMLAVAKGLGVESSDPAPVSPTEQNRAYEASLSQPDRERFNRVLFGESAADIAEANETGRVPAGRGEDFATGGCFGEASDAIPSVWDLRRQVIDELVAMNREVADSAELREAGVEYGKCALQVGGVTARGPADVDTIAAGGGSQAAAVATIVQKECNAIWANGRRQAEVAVAERFVQRNAAALATLESRYRDAISTIRGDGEFLRYLSEQVALAAVPEDGHAAGD